MRGAGCAGDEFKIGPAINILEAILKFLRAHIDKKLTQLAHNALTPFVTILITKMQDTELQCVLPDIEVKIEHTGLHLAAKASLQGIVGYGVDAKDINDGINAAIDEDKATTGTKGHTFEKKLQDIPENDPQKNGKSNRLLTFPAAWTLYGGCKGVGASIFGNGVGKVVNKKGFDSNNPDREVPRTDSPTGKPGAGIPVSLGFKSGCSDKITINPKGSGANGALAKDQEVIILSETVMAVQAFAFVTIARTEVNATLARFASAPIPDNDAALSASMNNARRVADTASKEPFSTGPGTVKGLARVGGKATVSCVGEKAHLEQLSLVTADGKPLAEASLGFNEQITNPGADDSRVSCDARLVTKEVFCEKRNGPVTVEGVVTEFGADIFSVHQSVARVRYQVYFATLWVAIARCQDEKRVRERVKVGAHVHFAGLSENPEHPEDAALAKALKQFLQSHGLAGDEDADGLKPPKNGFNKAQLEQAMRKFASGGNPKKPTDESLLGKALSRFDKCPPKK